MLKFILPIAPQVKERPRFGRTGSVYTPSKTARFQITVASLARCLMKGKKPYSGAIKLSVRFFFVAPKKPSRTYPSKGDTTNFVKALEDACNGIVWVDDVQIVKVDAEKLFDMNGGESRIEVQVEEVETHA